MEADVNSVDGAVALAGDAEAERASASYPTCRLGTCIGCDRWSKFSIKEQGWWEPACGFWNPKKMSKDEPYGVMDGCASSLEHVLGVSEDKWRLDKFEDYAAVAKHIEDNDRIAHVDVEFHPARMVVIYRGESVVVCLAERSEALELLALFVNTEMELKGASKEVVYDREKGWRFQSLAYAPRSMLPPPPPPRV